MKRGGVSGALAEYRAARRIATEPSRTALQGFEQIGAIIGSEASSMFLTIGSRSSSRHS
jgi:hypothetical protein